MQCHDCKIAGSASTSVDAQHLEVLLINSTACRRVAVNCSNGGQEISSSYSTTALSVWPWLFWSRNLPVEIHLRVSTNCDCTRATVHETHA